MDTLWSLSGVYTKWVKVCMCQVSIQCVMQWGSPILMLFPCCWIRYDVMTLDNFLCCCESRRYKATSLHVTVDVGQIDKQKERGDQVAGLPFVWISLKGLFKLQIEKTQTRSNSNVLPPISAWDGSLQTFTLAAPILGKHTSCSAESVASMPGKRSLTPREKDTKKGSTSIAPPCDCCFSLGCRSQKGKTKDDAKKLRYS